MNRRSALFYIIAWVGVPAFLLLGFAPNSLGGMFGVVVMAAFLGPTILVFLAYARVVRSESAFLNIFVVDWLLESLVLLAGLRLPIAFMSLISRE